MNPNGALAQSHTGNLFLSKFVPGSFFPLQHERNPCFLLVLELNEPLKYLWSIWFQTDHVNPSIMNQQHSLTIIIHHIIYWLMCLGFQESGKGRVQKGIYRWKLRKFPFLLSQKTKPNKLFVNSFNEHFPVWSSQCASSFHSPSISSTHFPMKWALEPGLIM